MAAGISQSDWPFNNRAVNGSKLSTRLVHNFDPTAIAEEQPRNTSAEVKCVALINSRRSRRIVTISFSPENGVRFDASCLSPGAEKYSMLPSFRTGPVFVQKELCLIIFVGHLNLRQPKNSKNKRNISAINCRFCRAF